MQRVMTSSTGAAKPIVLYEGIAANPKVPTVTRTMVRIIAGLRPARSANAPMTTPPRGRNRKPDQNTASVFNRLVVGSPAGKNAPEMKTAKNEKTRKS